MRKISTSIKKFDSNSNNSINSNSSTSTTNNNNEQLPWFITEPKKKELNQQPSPTIPKLATSPIPLLPPKTIPIYLHPLYSYLTISPFLNKDKITFINAREADPDGSWVEWIIVTELKKGREGGLRGAIEGVRTFLSKSPVNASPAPAPSPFAPPSNKPLISGLPTPPSKHARSRAPSPSRAEQASGWAMLDAGSIVVHVMTVEARENWGIETLWEGVKRESERQGRDSSLSSSSSYSGSDKSREVKEVLEKVEEEDEGGENEEEREREESEADEWEKKVV